nr:uncharacterized protein LOC101249667 [Solanum lycopersicum]
MATDIEKAELTSYQLKDVAKTWCKIEMMEVMVEEFINLKQGSMTVREYSLNFVKLSREAMLHDNMDLSRLMVHVQQVEERRKTKQTIVWNKSRQADINFSRKSSTEIRDNPSFKKGLSQQGESSSSKCRHDRNSESRVKRNNEVDTSQERPPCRKYGKLHGGECMRGTDACDSCGKLGHMMKDCPIRRSQEQVNERVQSNVPSEKAPRRQRFFALKSRGAEEGTFGEVTGN